jgi:hypothetical protein
MLNIIIFCTLYVMHTHNASMDLRRHMLHLGNEEVPLQCPGVQPHSTTVRRATVIQQQLGVVQS